MRARLRGLITSGLLLMLFGPVGCSGEDHLPEARQHGSIVSQHIMGRELVTSKSEVRHILIAWKDLSSVYGAAFDSRAAGRSQEEAEKLVLQLLRRARQGEDFRKLMKEHSEDSTTASSGGSYIVSLTAPLGPEFTKMGMRLYLGEIGVVKSPYGYHIIKRVQ
ncbi:MAG TPA: peptidylprolyl isomerase [Acidobacteriota bacterium]|nr:peptidylprolyl isomerase [Acidobacteriota bacterium]